MNKTILITNDDGFESEGLKALVEALKPFGRVIVVAPSSEKSACGHSLTLSHPLRFIKLQKDFYKLDDGTPSDCIYLATNVYFDNGLKPDLVVSGINNGANMGEDITYSGTVGGAMEGIIQGIPSIAVSQVYSDNKKSIDKYGYDLAKEVVYEVVNNIFKKGFPFSIEDRKFLNINIPPISKEDYKGIKITKAGYRIYGNDAHMHINPRGLKYYWLGVASLKYKDRKYHKHIMSDLEAVKKGYTSITPIKLDMTAYKEIKGLEKWF